MNALDPDRIADVLQGHCRGRRTGYTTAILALAIGHADFDVPDIVLTATTAQHADWLTRRAIEVAEQLGFTIDRRSRHGFFIKGTRFRVTTETPGAREKCLALAYIGYPPVFSDVIEPRARVPVLFDVPWPACVASPDAGESP